MRMYFWATVRKSLAKAFTVVMLHTVGHCKVCFCFHADSNFTMTPQQWDEVNDFVQTVGWDFIFGLNGLLRTPYPNGSWDSDNARTLLSYTASKGYTVQWELGNGV